LRIAAATASTLLASVALTSTCVTRSSLPASFCSVSSGKYTSAVVPASVGFTIPTTLYVPPLISSVEPTVSLFLFAYAAFSITSFVAVFAIQRPFDSWSGVTSPSCGFAASIPAAV
jgi:hypothetical protein